MRFVSRASKLDYGNAAVHDLPRDKMWKRLWARWKVQLIFGDIF